MEPVSFIWTEPTSPKARLYYEVISLGFWETVHPPPPSPNVNVNAGLGKGKVGSFPET